MKNLIIKSLFVSAIAFNLISCEDENNLTIKASSLQFTTVSPEDGSSIVLDKDLPNNPALTVSWTEAQYEGTATQITYAVEVDKDGDNFDTPYELGSSNNNINSLMFTAAQLNTACGTVGLAPDVAGTLNVRVKATIGTTGSEPMYSNVVNYTVTPYLAYLFKDYYLVGAATAPGWSNNSNNPPLWRNPDNEKLYEFTGYFVGGGGDPSKFKFLETLGAWQPQWGTNLGTAQSGALSGNPGTQSGDPGEFQITGPSGYYTFSINMTSTALTYAIVPYAGSTATTYSVVGMIGDAVGGWGDADQIDMTQVATDPHLWYKSNVSLANGPLKFRANNAWTVNWGANTQYSGTGTQDGPNIPVTGTNYNVWFNDLTGQYMMIPISN